MLKCNVAAASAAKSAEVPDYLLLRHLLGACARIAFLRGLITAIQAQADAPGNSDRLVLRESRRLDLDGPADALDRGREREPAVGARKRPATSASHARETIRSGLAPRVARSPNRSRRDTGACFLDGLGRSS